MRSRAAWLPLTLAAFIAGGTYWLQQAIQPEEKTGNARTRHEPDYWVTQLTVRKYNPQGTLENTLTSQRVLHYPDDNSSQFMQPEITWHAAPGGWARADRGWVRNNNEEVELQDNVQVFYKGKPGSPPIELRTRVLTVYPDEQKAHTDAPVTLTQGQSILHGVGLDADADKRIYVLRGRAQGVLYPQPKTATAPLEGRERMP